MLWLSEGFQGALNWSPMMPRDARSRTAKWLIAVVLLVRMTCMIAIDVTYVAYSKYWRHSLEGSSEGPHWLNPGSSNRKKAKALNSTYYSVRTIMKKDFHLKQISQGTEKALPLPAINLRSINVHLLCTYFWWNEFQKYWYHKKGPRCWTYF